MRLSNLLVQLLLLAGLLCFGKGLQAQTSLYAEDFGSQVGDGIVGFSGNSSPLSFTSSTNGWSVSQSSNGLTATSDYARVDNAIPSFSGTDASRFPSFVFRDVDENTTWLSPLIDISSYSTADLELVVWELGTHESSDFVRVEMIVDGTPTVLATESDDFSNVGGGTDLNPDFITISQTAVTGNSLQIRVTVLNGAGSEYILLDDVSVVGNGFNPPSCTFQFSSSSAVCDAITSGNDSYTATFNFSGAGNGDYTVTSNVGTVVLDSDPDVATSGAFRITGVPEGSDVTATVNSVNCSNIFSTLSSPSCNPQPDIVINEIHYNGLRSGTDQDEFVELFNNSGFAVDLSGWSFSEGFVFTFPQGTTIPDQGFLTIAFNPADFLNQYGFAPDFQWTSGGLSNSGEDIELRDASGNVQDFVDYDNGGVWPSAPDGFGPSLELNDPGLDNNNGANWSASIIQGGSPNAPNGTGCSLDLSFNTPDCETETLGANNDTYRAVVDFTGAGSDTYTIVPNAGSLAAASDNPDLVAAGSLIFENIPEGTDLSFRITSTGGCNAPVLVIAPVCEPAVPVVITEIMYNPREGGQDTTEYIELFNNSNVSVDLSGFTFVQGVSFTFPQGASIDAEAYIVIAGNATAFENFYGCAPDFEWTSGALSNGGELVLINTGTNAEVDRVDYDDANGWPTTPDGDGPSLELIDINGNNEDPANWEASAGFGTPGAANTGMISDCPPAAPVLEARADLYLFPSLSWNEVNFVDSYTVELSINGGAFAQRAILEAGTTTFTDTVVDFGVDLSYRVVATNVNGASASNTATVQYPATLQDLELAFTCYDIASNQLVWTVSNSNAVQVPYIYAQFFSPQRDTLVAMNGDSEFRTDNNPQVGATPGDDNITGIWWINEELLPGEPNAISFNVDLNNTCPVARMANTASPQAPQGLMKAKVFMPLLATNVKQDFLGTQIQVGPNPFGEVIAIESSELNGKATARLYDLTGRMVKEVSIQLGGRAEIQTSDLEKGVYLLSIGSGQGAFTTKVVKK